MRKREAEQTDYHSSPCRKCDHLCCNYITVKIPAPRTIHDFDGLLWQVSHENVAALRDSKGWYLIIYNKCSHLTRSGRCRIYENRPITCRDHSTADCEHQNGSIAASAYQYFDSFQSLEAHCRKRFKTWARRFGEPQVKRQ